MRNQAWKKAAIICMAFCMVLFSTGMVGLATEESEASPSPTVQATATEPSNEPETTPSPSAQTPTPSATSGAETPAPSAQQPEASSTPKQGKQIKMPLGGPITPRALSYNYSISAKKTHGSESDPVGPNDPVTVTFSLQINEYDDSILSKDFIVYIRNDIFSNLDPTADISFNGSRLDGSNEPVFKDNKLKRLSPDDKTGYQKYVVNLNDSQAAKDAYQGTQGGRLTNASFTFQLVMNPYLENNGEETIVIGSTNDSKPDTEGKIDVDNSNNPETSASLASKSIVRVLRPTNESHSSGKEVYTDVTPTNPQSDPIVVQPDDLVVFQVNVRNENRHIELDVTHIDDTLPDGYSFIGPSTTPYDFLIKSAGSVYTPTDMTNIYTAGVSFTPNWVLQSGTTYRHTFSPNLTLSKYDPAGSGFGARGFIVAKVTNLDDPDLVNTIIVEDNSGQPGRPGSNTAPTYARDYDLALTTQITRVFDKDGELTATYANQSSSITKDSYVQVEVTIYNQGKPAKDVDIRTYIPTGFSLPATSSLPDFKGVGYTKPAGGNNAWSASGSFAKNVDNGYWSDLSAYSANYPGVIPSGGKVTLNLFLKVDNLVDPSLANGGLSANDFLLAGEISDFKDEGGGVVTDIDSIPGTDPALNLYDNRTAHSSTLHKLVAGSVNAKEKLHYIQGRAQLQTTGTSPVDEDDFDYDSSTFIVASSTTEITPPVTKMRKSFAGLTTTQQIQTRLGSLFGSYSDIPSYLLTNLNYKPLPDNGLITNPKSFMVYEFWVNKDGLLDLEGMTLEDQLPDGMKFLKFPSGSATPNKLALRAIKYVPVTRVSNPSGEQVISYENSLMSLTHKATSLLSCYELQADGSLGNVDNKYANSDTNNVTGNLDAAGCGVEMNLSNNDTKLSIKFGTPNNQSLKAYTDTKSAYFFRAIVLIDNAHPNFEDEMKNTVTLTKPGYSYESSEGGSIRWYSEGGHSVIQKHARINDNDEFVTAPSILDATPDANGDVVVTYRVRYRSQYTFAQNSVRVDDAIPLGQFDSFVGQPEVSGHSYSMNGTEMVVGADLPKPLAITAQISNNSITISNTVKDTGAGELYDIVFKVKYRNWEYGETLVNRIGGQSTLATIPLRLSVLKEDADSKTALSGYEFEAYYADANHQADLAKPVRNVDGDPIVFNDTQASHYFRPEGYVYGTAGDWEIVLVERKAPTGYSRNVNNQYILHVSADTSGKLTLSEVGNTNDGYVISYSADKKLVTATVHDDNDSKALDLSLLKVDAANDSTVLKGARFTLERPDGQTMELNTDASGVAAIQLPTRGYEGTYTLTETSAPTGYDKLAAAITFDVDANGKITSVSDESVAFVSGYARVELTVRNTKTGAKTTTGTTDDKTKQKSQGIGLPKTGDENELIFWAIMVVLYGSGCAVLLLEMRKRRKQKRS